MTLFLQKHEYFTIIISFVSGLFVYSVLSYLFVDPKVSLPVSITIAVLIFGLIRYYTTSEFHSNSTLDPNSSLRDNKTNDIHNRDQKGGNESWSTVFFIAIFALIILVAVFTNEQDLHIFISWNDVGLTGLVQLGVGITLCFFFPGYAVVLIITKKRRINPILKVLLAYFMSMLITGLSAYILATSFDKPISESKDFFIAIYLSILATLLIFYLPDGIKSTMHLKIQNSSCYRFLPNVIIKFRIYLKTKGSQLLIFASLLLLLILSTYYAYGGITISDQWYHQGRALLFMSGSFREAVLDGADVFYPPFQHAMLAALATISGVPLVNAYASIAFLNIIPVFAFYYFFSKWVSPSMHRATTLAASLFAISSGFNWIYFLGLATWSHPIYSQHSFLEILNSIGTVTIIRPTNFIFSAEPDFSTGLIYIALPAGLVLLGIIRERFQPKLKCTALVTIISTIGILSHDEFFIFIIVGSLLPIIFKIKEQNYTYLGLMFSFSIVFLMDILIPVHLYTAQKLFDVPLLFLNFLFVILLWVLYVGRKYLYRCLQIILLPLRTLMRRVAKYMHPRYFVLSVLVIFIAYMYVLSNITFAQLSITEVRADTRGYIVPWYLYPMKLGLAGLLGLVFIVSYFVKKFDTNLFVFGVIIIVAFITGAYYDQHRFSKFMMVGLVAYASLFIYKILNSNFKNRLVINGILISAIIICSGFSVVIFIGANSLVEQTQDYTINPKRKFPSSTELDLFETLRHNIDVASKKYNIVSFPVSYNFTKPSPLISKLQGFSGFPYAKLLQSPLTLNSSSLDGFYRQLNYSDARYIILPKDSLQYPITLTEPTRFALEYFHRFYEDNHYIVLDVPDFEPPSSSINAKIALVYDEIDESRLPQVFDKMLLPYNNTNFYIKGKDEFVSLQDANHNNIVLFGSKTDNGISLWSRPSAIEINPNYIETEFRITSENHNKTDQVRLKWREADREYYVSLSNDGLQLNQYKINNPDDKKIFKNTEIKKKAAYWYKLRIESLGDSVNVYIDNVLKIKAPKPPLENQSGITRIALTSLDNTVEYGPINIGKVPQKTNDQMRYYDYYYPLSLLALSKNSYDIFRAGDLSAFSKDVVVISDTMKFDNVTFNNTLQYARDGGTLVVINPYNNFSGIYSKLFSIDGSGSRTGEFTKITDSKSQDSLIEVPGLVKTAELKSSPGVKEIASYTNDKNDTIAPLAIEKSFSNGGRIVLINAGGYFDALTKSPNYFPSLSNISKLIGLVSNNATNFLNTSIPIKGFIGDMDISGDIRLNSTSFSLVKDSYPSIINASRIEISNKSSNLRTLDNVMIKNLTLVGKYNAIINFTGGLQLPDITSDRDYISLIIPSQFNMTIILHPGKFSHMEMVLQNGSTINSIKLNGESKIQIYNVRNASSSSTSVPVLLKNPDIKVKGHTNFERATLKGYLTQRGDPNKGTLLDVEGELKAKFAFVDNYNQPYRNGTRTDFITFFESLVMHGAIDEHRQTFKLPAHIFSVEAQGADMNLIGAIGSPSNIVILLVIFVISIIVGRFFWQKKNLRIR